MSNEPTHAVTMPNTRPPMPLEVLRQELARDYQKQITNYFNGDKDKAMKFMSAVIYSVQKNPNLLECDRTSLLQSFMSAAEFQLYPSNVAGEAYIIPYKGKAQFQLGYQGLITLLWRAGVNIRSNIVRANDEFKYNEGLNANIIHNFDPFKGERGKPIGVYAIATIEDRVVGYKVLSEDDVMKFKNLSQARDSKYSPWNSEQDPELWMWQKTCIKQLAKTLPKTEVLQKAIAEDNEDSTIPKASLDAEGPAVGRALHDPAPPQAPKAEIPKTGGKADIEITAEDIPK